ncbi:hypothetical protein OUQ99_14865 [Streptomonospora nanhaiensis]|uniref:DUF6924 domain-containing protein n=1 Tax=Streptomonospora nanhaiensis TaxID=1323731 RepID=A0ABY6YWP1_9ACTN|nr:hypothetical protein [Streptomonospora nanhaiensis]WAE76280.1 hypothetical protein OUQ99_14865 [Streptomonospora nanhaiensis]
MHPTLNLPPASDGPPAPGLLIVRTDYADADAWEDVRSRLGDLPGAYPPGPGPVSAREAAILEKNPKHLVVVDDPAWSGAGPDEVGEALHRAGAWTPGLVLLADGTTMADARLRPLLAFRDGEGSYRIGPRAAAVFHLLAQALDEDFADGFAEDEGSSPEPDDVFGARLELSARPVPYRAPDTRMELLPRTEDALIIRTDHTDDAVWEAVVAEVRAPVPDGAFRQEGEEEEFYHAYVDVLDDPRYAGATTEQILSLVPRDYEHNFLIIADRTTMGDPRHPLLLVDLYDEPGLSFRAVPVAIQAIENNLSIANMDFSDFYIDEGYIQYWEARESLTDEQIRL